MNTPLPRRDWSADAERLQRDVDAGDELLPVGRLRRYAAGASPSAVTRWIVNGKRGVTLDGTRGPGKTWLSTKRALMRFFAALAAVQAGRPVPTQPPAGVAREAAEAIDRLRKAGVPV